MSKIEFPAPKGFTPPEGSDDEFDMVCSFKVRNGKLCMTKLGDTPMYGADKETKPDYSSMANEMVEASQERNA